MHEYEHQFIISKLDDLLTLMQLSQEVDDRPEDRWLRGSKCKLDGIIEQVDLGRVRGDDLAKLIHLLTHYYTITITIGIQKYKDQR
jgi:hypothetical protein